MSKKTLIPAILLSAAGLMQLHAQDYNKFAFNIGGGINTPLNPTANYAGLGGNFAAGAGYNINKKNTIFAEFQWNGLPPNRILHLPNAPFGSVNMYSITTNYKHSVNFGHSPFGGYVVGGGGWYYRFASIDKTYTVLPGTPCLPVYFWWGYGCETTVTETIASKGTSAGGINAGVGMTIRLSDKGWKFYVESRYNYAWSNRIASTYIPVTFGFRFN